MTRRRALIYGATGYTGALVARALMRRGIPPVLGGRRAPALKALGSELGLEVRVFTLDSPTDLRAALRDVHTVLHAAGPFVQTTRSVVEACLDSGVHYADLTAEVDVFESLRELDAQARARGITLLPGVGHAVTSSDCLAVHVAARLPGAHILRIALSGLGSLSRGSARSLVLHAGEPMRARVDGELRPVPRAALRRFDFGYARHAAVPVGWADISTAHHSTGIPNIETYLEAVPALRAVLAANRWFPGVLRAAPTRSAMLWQNAWWPEGPSSDRRASARAAVVAEVEDPSGQRRCARLITPEVYRSSAEAAAAACARLLIGDVEPGFQTPGSAFGADFVLSLPDVVRQDLPSL